MNRAVYNRIAFILMGLSVASLVVLAGCTPSGDGPRTSQQFAQQLSGRGADQKKTDQKKTDQKSDAKTAEGRAADRQGKEQQPAFERPVFPVQTVRARTTEARLVLEQNYEGFLTREKTVTSLQHFRKLGEQLRGWGQTLAELPDRIQAMAARQVLAYGLPYLIIAAFIAGLFALSRQIGELSHRLQARLHLELSRWTTRLLRRALLVVGRLVSVAFLLILSYFPIQALFNHAPWTAALTRCLWLLLGYRAIAGVISAMLSGRLVDLTDEQAEQLEGLAVQATGIIFAFLIVMAVLQTMGAGENVRQVLRFVFRAALIGLPIYLMFFKDAVAPLLPRDLDSKGYDLFRGALIRNFRLLMAATAALLAMRIAGFVNATDFLLLRGYIVLAIVLAAFIGRGRLHQFFQRRIEFLRPHDQEEVPLETTDHEQLQYRLDQLLGVTIWLLVVILLLQLLQVFQPTLILLKIPLLAVGQAEISLLNVLNVAFVIFGTVLTFKLLRAVLNAKVYPIFEVDVGVAYAVNTVVKYAIIVMAFLLGITALGINLTALTVVLASLGVGIGFGLQTLVENLVSGFIILFGRSVQKGDYITVEGTYGQVEAVGARSVVISTPDNYRMLIPSKQIVGGQIINWSYEDNIVRAILSVGVSYKSEPRQVEDVLLEATKTHPLVMDKPKPRVRLSEFGDSSINFEVLFFFDCRDITERMLVGEINFDIWKALADAGIEIPFPQRDLHLKSDEQWERLREVAERMQGGANDTEDSGGTADEAEDGRESGSDDLPP